MNDTSKLLLVASTSGLIVYLYMKSKQQNVVVADSKPNWWENTPFYQYLYPFPQQSQPQNVTITTTSSAAAASSNTGDATASASDISARTSPPTPTPTPTPTPPPPTPPSAFDGGFKNYINVQNPGQFFKSEKAPPYTLFEGVDNNSKNFLTKL